MTPTERATPVTGANDPLSVPPGALRVDAKGKVILTPWLVEGSLAGAGAVGIGMSGAGATTTQLATILFLLSLGGLLILLVAETRARKRWTVR